MDFDRMCKGGRTDTGLNVGISSEDKRETGEGGAEIIEGAGDTMAGTRAAEADIGLGRSIG